MSAILGAARGIAASRARRGRGLGRRVGAAGGAPFAFGGRGRGRMRHRRGRGISMAGIRAARKLLNLLRDFQSALPRGRHLVAPRPRRHFFKRGRRGDMPFDEGDG